MGWWGGKGGKREKKGKEENKDLLSLPLTGRKTCGIVLSTASKGDGCWLVAGQEDILAFDSIGLQPGTELRHVTEVKYSLTFWES